MLIMEISNFKIIGSWIDYLKRENIAQALIGANKKTDVLTAIEKWQLLQREESFRIGLSLKDDGPMDVGVEYSAEAFMQANGFDGLAGDRYNHFFKFYSKYSGSKGKFLLELNDCETALDDFEIFFRYPVKRTDDLTDTLLSFKAMLRYSSKVSQLLMPGLRVVKGGGMLSKKSAPLKLFLGNKGIVYDFNTRFKPIENLVTALFSSARGKVFKKIPLLEDLNFFNKLTCFDCLLEVEVLPNGLISPKMQVELICFPRTLEGQHSMFVSAAYKSFAEFLRGNGLADERLGAVEKSCFGVNMGAPREDNTIERFYSTVDHFHLCYDLGERKEARVYLMGQRK